MNGPNHPRSTRRKKVVNIGFFASPWCECAKLLKIQPARLDMKRTYKLCHVIYKIVRRVEWNEAEALGLFVGSTDDRRDGFIHFSTRAQLPATAQTHFGGQDDLLLVALDASQFGDALKWERARSGDLYPHLYASSFAISVVLWKRPLPLDRDGRHLWPPEIG
jgi:uncharacterized protein (DUF952 family)